MRPVIHSFNGGMISELLDTRSDIEKYGNSCRNLQNMFCLTQGAVSKRPGTELIGEAGGEYSKLIPFARSNKISYILELAKLYTGSYYLNNFFYVYQDGSKITIGIEDVVDFDGTKYYQINDLIRYKKIGNDYYGIYICHNPALGDNPHSGSWAELNKYTRDYNSVSEYNNLSSYDKNALCRVEDVTYLSLVDSNVGNDPTISPLEWEQTPLYYFDYAFMLPTQSPQLEKFQYVQLKDVMYLVSNYAQPVKISSTGSADWKIERVNFNYGAFKDENINDDKTFKLTGDFGAYTKWISYPIDAIVKIGIDYYQCIKAIDVNTYVLHTDTNYWNFIGPYLPLVYPIGSIMEAEFNTITDDELYTPDKLLVKYPRTDNSISEKLTSTGETTTEMPILGEWNLVTHGTWDGTIEVQRKIKNEDWIMIRTYSSDSDRNVDVTGDEDLEGALYRIEYTLKTTGNVVVDLNTRDAYNDIVFELTPNGDVRLLSTLEDSYINQERTTFAVGAWSGLWKEFDDQNYPQTVALFEERLFLGGCKQSPMTLWSSKTDDYENLRTGVNATNALIYTLSSDKAYRIEWLKVQKHLIIGTSGDEWTLGADKVYEPLTPTSVKAIRQSINGSSDVNAEIINNSLFYVKRGGRTIFEMNYDYRLEGYDSVDITPLAKFITESGIKRIMFLSNPYPILFCLRNDGKLAGFTYEKSQEVFGWHLHITVGYVKDICVIPENEIDSLYIITERKDYTLNVNEYYVEKFMKWDYELNDIDKFKFSDAMVSFNNEMVNYSYVSSEGYITFNNKNIARLYENDYVRIVNANEDTSYNDNVYKVVNADYNNFKLLSLNGGHLVMAYNSSGIDLIKVVKDIDVRHIAIYNINLLSIMTDNKFIGTKASIDGIIKLDDYYDNAIVGLSYISILEPMYIEGQVGDGGTNSLKKRTTQVSIRFNKTTDAQIQYNDTEEMDIHFRDPLNPTNNAIDLFTGWKKVKCRGGFEDDISIKIKSQNPYPLTVACIQTWTKVYN